MFDGFLTRKIAGKSAKASNRKIVVFLSVSTNLEEGFPETRFRCFRSGASVPFASPRWAGVGGRPADSCDGKAEAIDFQIWTEAPERGEHAPVLC